MGFVTKYQPDGTREWTRTVGTPTSNSYQASKSARGYTSANQLAISTDDFIYAYGHTSTQSIQFYDGGYGIIPNLFYGQSHKGSVDLYVAQYDAKRK